ncbi:hypothetical protein M752DRAFT_134180 [Aspergillus phoenicis ATCC 13157]|uniref:Uncharacterized protein n=1 Tax=Aspergillus phoenicis ATCC 13157 TaxID=1353007 RepID=A0A370PSP1_ASPPH|nr:hypothetical protein M752DRAFT_134180 [Aspergillus phoenicis ATCC 13157]
MYLYSDTVGRVDELIWSRNRQLKHKSGLRSLGDRPCGWAAELTKRAGGDCQSIWTMCESTLGRVG